jgi:hypothetical protein
MDHDPAIPLESPAADVAGPVRRRRSRARAVVLGALAVLLVGTGLWAARHWLAPPPPEAPSADRPEDPRRTYAGPFQNVHPDVAYVGDEKCAPCHRDLALSYRQHPMGRSLRPIVDVAARERYDAESHNPFNALGTQFRVERHGQRVLHRQVGRDEKGEIVYQSDGPAVDYVLGSGEHGHSYLIDRDGYVYASPVSWFSHKQIWDTSPGFGSEARPGRPVPAMCLFCHANRTRPREGYINRYEEPLFDGCAIGCERCHGPGELHARSPGRKDPATGADYTIVNPHHLEPELRAAVCEQCHLAGESRVLRRGRDLYDFRPGLPLEDFQAVFVPAADSDEPHKAVNHVEQMYRSRCFVASREAPAEGERKLGCTSCHDPHRHIGPPERAAYYRQRCLACHEKTGCSVPEATRRLTNRDDSCTDCHMPRYPPSDIAHTAATDHRVLRRPDADRRRADDGAAARAGRPLRGPRLVSFYRQRPGDRDSGRDLGIALVHDMAQGLLQRKAPSPEAGRQAVALLEAAAQNDPDDLKALEVRAEALSILGRPEEAQALYEAVLARAPEREVSLMGAAMLAQSRRQREQALAYWRRAVAENPWQPYYRASLAQLLADRKAWAEARPHSEAWLRLDPASIEARVLWVKCLLHTGDKARARAEFTTIERLRPPNLPLLQARFSVELRGS